MDETKIDPRVELNNFAEALRNNWKSPQSKNVMVEVGAHLVEQGIPLEDVKEALSELYEAFAFEFGRSDKMPREPIDDVPYNEMGAVD